MQEKIEKKSINNAICAYLMIFISWLLFLAKDNEYINNDFVKKHVKSSVIIHLLFVIVYIIFIGYGFLGAIGIQGFFLNIIIANILFLSLFAILVFGIYKASKGEDFNIGSFLKSRKAISLDINNDKNFNEKDKLTIVISHIPFIGYIAGAKYNNKLIQDILTFNLFISVIITLVYILGYGNLGAILSLVYIIYAVFVGVNLFSRDELVSITLPYYFSPNKKIALQKNIIKYIKLYISGNFKEFNQIVSEEKEAKDTLDKKESDEVNSLRTAKIPELLIYIPIINLFTLFVKESSYKLHIRNGLTITVLTIVLAIFAYLAYIPTTVLLLVLFPICFGIGYLKTKYYKMPYIYELYMLWVKTKRIFIRSKKELKQRHSEVNEVSLKVK